ncbi:hypothetical protein QCA50_002939 [Cerrena zonata]|uniref:C2H2-type domain-containing protein n=1 Tax=Cerrena zonata TaxID=2478898 RepID=A0AAW0GL15_9APHY
MNLNNKTGDAKIYSTNKLTSVKVGPRFLAAANEECLRFLQLHYSSADLGHYLNPFKDFPIPADEPSVLCWCCKTRIRGTKKEMDRHTASIKHWINIKQNIKEALPEGGAGSQVIESWHIDRCFVCPIEDCSKSLPYRDDCILSHLKNGKHASTKIQDALSTEHRFYGQIFWMERSDKRQSLSLTFRRPPNKREPQQFTVTTLGGAPSSFPTVAHPYPIDDTVVNLGTPFAPSPSSPSSIYSQHHHQPLQSNHGTTQAAPPSPVVSYPYLDNQFHTKLTYYDAYPHNNQLNIAQAGISSSFGLPPRQIPLAQRPNTPYGSSLPYFVGWNPDLASISRQLNDMSVGLLDWNNHPQTQMYTTSSVVPFELPDPSTSARLYTVATEAVNQPSYHDFSQTTEVWPAPVTSLGEHLSDPAPH